MEYGRPGTSITDESVELFIKNSYNQAITSIKSTIYKFYAIYVRLYGKKDLNFGETTRGFCTMTTQRHTPRYSSNSSWQNGTEMATLLPETRKKIPFLEYTRKMSEDSTDTILLIKITQLFPHMRESLIIPTGIIDNSRIFRL